MECCVDKNVIAEIVFDLWSLSLRLLSVPLDPRSVLALTTLVPAFLDSSKHGPYARYCSSR